MNVEVGWSPSLRWYNYSRLHCRLHNEFEKSCLYLLYCDCQMMIRAHISSEIWGTMMSVTTEHTDTNKISQIRCANGNANDCSIIPIILESFVLPMLTWPIVFSHRSLNVRRLFADRWECNRKILLVEMNHQTWQTFKFAGYFQPFRGRNTNDSWTTWTRLTSGISTSQFPEAIWILYASSRPTVSLIDIPSPLHRAPQDFIHSTSNI